MTGGNQRAVRGRLSFPAGSRRKDLSAPLTLAQIAVLRRVEQKQTYEQIGAALGRSAGSIGHMLYAMRRRFGVADMAELLALPQIRRDLDG